MNYGLAYGLSAFGLGAQLRIDPAEARGLMDEYFETFGGIRDYLSGIVDEARKAGFTETIMGRRRYLPDLTSDNRQRREMAERMALNAPIQGSAADLIKVAMLDVDKAICEAGLKSRMLLQVHDELVFEVAPGEQDALTEAGPHRHGRRGRADRAAGRVGRHRPQLARGRSLIGSDTVRCGFGDQIEAHGGQDREEQRVDDEHNCQQRPEGRQRVAHSDKHDQRQSTPGRPSAAPAGPARRTPGAAAWTATSRRRRTATAGPQCPGSRRRRRRSARRRGAATPRVCTPRPASPTNARLRVSACRRSTAVDIAGKATTTTNCGRNSTALTRINPPA